MGYKFKWLKASLIGRTVGKTQFVICKKSIKTFKKGETYIITGMYGDPQGAHEAGYEFMITNFLNVIIVMDGLNGKPGQEFYFEWKGRKKYTPRYETVGDFQDYFFVDIAEERKLKLNNLKN